jgi:hypothetical protein
MISIEIEDKYKITWIKYVLKAKTCLLAVIKIILRNTIKCIHIKERNIYSYIKDK